MRITLVVSGRNPEAIIPRDALLFRAFGAPGPVLQPRTHLTMRQLCALLKFGERHPRGDMPGRMWRLPFVEGLDVLKEFDGFVRSLLLNGIFTDVETDTE